MYTKRKYTLVFSVYAGINTNFEPFTPKHANTCIKESSHKHAHTCLSGMYTKTYIY